MYSRQISDSPEQIIKNGKAQFGTYRDVPSKIDIKGIRAPYAGIPLPPFITKLRIKSRINYFFSTEKYIGMTEFYDFKVIGLAQFIVWNKETNRKNAYHSLMPPRRRFVPMNTKNGSATSFNKARHIRISWGRNHQHLALSFNLKGRSEKQNAEGFISSPIQDSMHSDYLFVNPSPTSSRCSASWFTAMQTRGVIRLKGDTKDESTGLAAMTLNRTYYKFHSHTDIICGLGEINHKNIIFTLKSSTMDASDNNAYNDNILVVDGQNTLLPPVYITHSFGTDKNWIIQDTENMIDLVFTPTSIDRHTFNLIALRDSTISIYGTFEGVLLTKDGEKLSLKNFPGILNSNTMRL